MIINMALVVIVLGSVISAHAQRTAPATFYVDSEKGDDAAEGLLSAHPWRSLERVNKAELVPGDKILFKRGGLWRGRLFSQSGTPGAPILYGTYGEGAKPILQGSVPRDCPDQWQELQPGVWSTTPRTPKIFNQIMDLTDSMWNPSIQEEAKGTIRRTNEGGVWFNRFTCQNPGTKRNLIQLWGPQIRETSDCLLLRVRVRSTLPFKMETVEIMLNRPPWTIDMLGKADPAVIGAEWQTIDIILYAHKKAAPADMAQERQGG